MKKWRAIPTEAQAAPLHFLLAFFEGLRAVFFFAAGKTHESVRPYRMDGRALEDFVTSVIRVVGDRNRRHFRARHHFLGPWDELH